MESKPTMPEPKPVIEILPGLRATLIADFDRYSNGSLPFGGSWMAVRKDGDPIGEIGCSATGAWYVKVSAAWYEVNMSDAFAAFSSAHQKSREAQ